MYVETEFSPFEALTTVEMDQMGENDARINDGTAIEDGAINARQIDFASTGGGSGIWWEEIGRATLGVAGDVITVSDIEPRKYLRIQLNLRATSAGAMNTVLNFNEDLTANYSQRLWSGGVAGSTASLTRIDLESGNSASSGNTFVVIDVFNVATLPKLLNMVSTNLVTAGSGTAPGQLLLSGHWADTTSAISSITVSNNASASDFASGSEIVVLGHN